jgi:hypothetical protein
MRSVALDISLRNGVVLHGGGGARCISRELTLPVAAWFVRCQLNSTALERNDGLELARVLHVVRC